MYARSICLNVPQEPVKITLGTERKPKGTGAKQRVVEIDECMVYVPILKILEFLYQNELVTNEMNINIVL